MVDEKDIKNMTAIELGLEDLKTLNPGSEDYARQADGVSKLITAENALKIAEMENETKLVTAKEEAEATRFRAKTELGVATLEIAKTTVSVAGSMLMLVNLWKAEREDTIPTKLLNLIPKSFR